MNVCQLEPTRRVLSRTVPSRVQRQRSKLKTDDGFVFGVCGDFITDAPTVLGEVKTKDQGISDVEFALISRVAVAAPR